MKNIALILILLFAVTCLPIGVMADDTSDQPAIPNHTTEVQDDKGEIPNLAEVEGKDLNPTERRIILEDTIRSNANTGIQTGQ